MGSGPEQSAILKSVKHLAIFLSSVILVVMPGPVLAVTNPQNSTSSVSATVLDQSFNAPVLLAPAHNATVKTARPTFSWLRPSPLPITPLNYYDFYLDGVVFAGSLADSLTSVDFYFYSATASAGTFYVTLKTDLSQGYHTWKVIAYNSAPLSASSTTRTFYVDSIPPFISVTKVDNTTLTWDTSLPASLPAGDSRYLTASVPDPVITGGVEASANFQIILVCPLNIPTCVNQIYAANLPSGLWSTQFIGLVSGLTYTIQASATDASGNSTLFPDFYLTYGTALTPTASPSAFPTLPLPSGIKPPPGLLATITPAPFENIPPATPTPPPPARVDRAWVTPQNLFYYSLLVLIILGLPLHLLMSIMGTKTPLGFIPRFLLILAYPFLRPKTARTAPFTSITIFMADRLDKPWQRTVSDIQGFFTLKSPVPENLYVLLSAVDRYWKGYLLRGTTLINSCLYPLPVSPPDRRSRLLKGVYDIRIIPLIIACLSSVLVMFIKPSYPVFIYAYLSAQYLFSEYIYPKL